MSGANRTVVIGATFAAVLAGLLLVWWSATPSQNVHAPPVQGATGMAKPRQVIDTHPHAEQAGVGGPLAGPMSPASAQPGELHATLEKALSNLPPSAPAPGVLIQSINDTLHAYVSEDISEFDAYCSLHGIDSLDSTASDPAYVPYMWSQFHAWFKTAIVNHDELTIRWRVQGGVDQVVDEAQSVRTASRDVARAFWMLAALRDRRSIEVVFPLVAKDLDGVIFESRLGLEFGYNAAAGSWILLRSRQYDVPANTRLVEAPV